MPGEVMLTDWTREDTNKVKRRKLFSNVSPTSTASRTSVSVKMIWILYHLGFLLRFTYVIFSLTTRKRRSRALVYEVMVGAALEFSDVYVYLSLI